MVMTRLAELEKKVKANTDRINDMGGAIMKKFDITAKKLGDLHEMVNEVLP